MSGALFMRPYRGAHTGHWIKQSDEARAASGSVVDDGELVRPLKPNTIYLFRCMLYWTGQMGSGVWRPACTSAVDFASIVYHRRVSDTATEQWGTASAGDHQGHMLDTAAFNAGTTFSGIQQGGRRCYGMIQTGSGGGSFSIQWGGGAVGSRTLKAGSFIYLQEVPASAIIIKQTDESRASNTTLTDDGELTIALAAGSTYFIDSNLIFDSGAAIGFKQAWTYTGTLTSVGLSEGTVSAVLPGTGGTGDALSRAWHVGTGALLTTPTVRVRAGSNTANTIGGGHLRGVIVTNSSGNLKIQWAQNVSNVGNTTVHKGSYICVATGADITDVFGILTYKTGDTSRTNNTVTADPDLQFATKANSKYIAENFSVFDSSSGTPDAQFGIHDAQANLSAGHVLRINLQAVGTFGNSTDTALCGQWNTSAWITTPTLTAPQTSLASLKNSMSVLWAQQQGGSAGTSSVDWAQNTTNATPTIMRTGSWILSEEVFQ